MNHFPKSSLATVLILLCLIYFQSSFSQSFAEFSHLLAPELLTLCKSIDSDKKDFCKGYIEGTSHRWRVATACQSDDDADRSFCAGAIAAMKRVSSLYQICRDCDHEQRNQLHRDLAQVVGTCSPTDQESSFYCEGFNLEVRVQNSSPSLCYETEPMDNVRTCGLSLGFSDFQDHSLYSYEFRHYLLPCIDRDAEFPSMMAAIDRFAADYPEILQLETSTTFIKKALFYSLCPGPPEQLSPHLEHCTNWKYEEDSAVTENSCSKPIFIQFKTESGPVIKQDIGPGERFAAEVQTSDYIYTACRSGYVSSIPFLEENWELIASSGYHCVKQ